MLLLATQLQENAEMKPNTACILKPGIFNNFHSNLLITKALYNLRKDISYTRNDLFIFLSACKQALYYADNYVLLNWAYFLAENKHY